MPRIGIRRADITPPVGIPLIGFAGRGPAIGVHDPLYATALVASDGSQTIALIACDLLYVSADLTAAVRQEIEGRLGIPGTCVALTCTHTHYGPETDPESSHPDVAAYLGALMFQLAGLVQEAMASRQTALLGVGWGQSDIGINRRERRPDGSIWLGRNPGGPVDRSVGVCRIGDACGVPMATIVNFAAHPVSQNSRMQLVSSDYPGQARQVIERLTGAPCLFLQGACGDINAVRMEDSYEPARSLGVRLGCEVVRVWETIAPSHEGCLASASEVRRLPGYRYGSAEHASALAAELDDEVRRLQAEKAPEGARYWAELRLKRAREAVASWHGGPALEPVDAEFQAYRLGDLAWATAPAEVFNEIGGEVKALSPFRDTFFVGYANGSIGYLPTPNAYDEGGYEVTHACRVDPAAAGIAIETCSRLLQQVAATGPTGAEEGTCASTS